MKDSGLMFPGINIQYPISRLIIEKSKTIETRTYPLPRHYVGRELLIIETPGPTGKFKARLIGKIIFGPSFQYKSPKAFYLDESKHCVNKFSPWKWTDQPKWGWPILKVVPFSENVPAPIKRGIKFTKEIPLPY